jgi:pSer/pThr/pTyr-binding forkhead associated (FHA) protein
MPVDMEALKEMSKAAGPEDMERTSIHLPQRGAEEVEEVAWIVIMKTPSVRLHQMFRLDSARMEIGRAYDTPIFLDDRTVSMRHAAIKYERVDDQDEFVLYDLASTNGTYLNGASVHLAVLKDDDRIRVGETELAFKKVGEPKLETITPAANKQKG